MHRFPQRSGSFSMNDPHLEDAFFPARLDIFLHQVFYLRRLKGVQIQCPVDYHRILVFERQIRGDAFTTTRLTGMLQLINRFNGGILKGRDLETAKCCDEVRTGKAGYFRRLLL